MLGCAILGLVLANLPATAHLFETVAETHLGIPGTDIDLPLGHWAQDGLLTIFFLTVGLDLKQELTTGSLANPKAAAVPMLCAVGGMVMPPILFLTVVELYARFGPPAVGEATVASGAVFGFDELAQGWAIPTATDIAFALGILALLGNRVPSGVRVFLSTLAVADDIIAILVIAVFYGHSPSMFWLGMAAAVLVVLVLMNRSHIYSLVPYLLVGAVLWYCVFMSGVHSTIAGVLLAFVIPSGSRVNLESFISWSGDKVRQARDAFQPETPVIAQGDYIKTVADLSQVTRQVVPPATRLEHKLYPWVYFGILPLFALTNADVSFTGMDIGSMLTDPVLYGVMLGLLVGKPLGIMLMSFAIVKSKLASLPENVNWFHMLGASILGGVGFTMAIFVANLAYTDEMHIATAKLAILAASLLAGVLGFVFLLLQAKAAQKRGVAYVSASSDDVARQTAGSEVARESEELLRGIEDHPAIKSELEAAKKRGGVFEIVVDLGPTGLLGGGSIGDVREAVRNEVVRVLKEEGKDDLLEKVQEDFNDEGKPPLLSVEEALLREGGEEALRRALHREEEDVEGMSGDADSRNER